MGKSPEKVGSPLSKAKCPKGYRKKESHAKAQRRKEEFNMV
jgi:hypothetical protein